MTDFRFFATTPRNMESLLVDELGGLGCVNVTETRAGAAFTASLEMAYRACLWSRVANTVLLELGRFTADTAGALYAAVRAIDWHAHFDPGQTFAVDFHSARSVIRHSHFGALKVKDAVVDQFRERTGRRPSIDTDRPQIRINVYVLGEEATVSLDLAGESLHRRGYRQQGVAAPLKENLAAAILLRSGWPEVAAAGGSLVDPMCGSGTLPVEAALIAADIAPGLRRDHWGFLAWKHHDPAAWRTLVAEAEERAARGLARMPDIRGYDHDAAAVRVALANAARAGLQGRLHVERRALGDCAPVAASRPGLVVVNPPYGERLGADVDLPALYRSLGQVLKERFDGWRAAVFTANPELGKSLGLRARRMHSLYNGALECKLLHFEVNPEWYLSERRFPHPLPPAERGEGSAAFANRLKKNSRQLERWRRREEVHCYRLYDADLPEYAVALDVYEGERRWVHVQEYEAPPTVEARKARRRLREALGVILDVLEIPEEQLFFKVRRQQKGRAQYGKLGETRAFHEVREGACRFLVNFEDYLDTGLFLDHRITRRRLAELAEARHFLNLFAYTGTATVCAARGGALSTTTVDMSNTYLDWARRNMALNGFDGPAHAFVRTDCLEWLSNGGDRRRYGLIFLDPPSFSASKRMAGSLDVQRDHVALIRAAARLLEPGGVLVFSNNLRRFRLDREALADLDVEDITRATLPPDFARNPRIHHCWEIRPRMAGGGRAGPVA